MFLRFIRKSEELEQQKQQKILAAQKTKDFQINNLDRICECEIKQAQVMHLS